MTTVTFNRNDVAGAMHAWMQSDSISQETAVRATALLKSVCDVAGEAIDGLMLTFKTYEDFGLMPAFAVLDFTNLVNDEGLRPDFEPRDYDSDEEPELRRVYCKNGSWIISPGREGGASYGLESELLIVLPGKIAAFIYSNPFFSRDDKFEERHGKIEKSGYALACLDRGAIMGSLNVYTKHYSAAKMDLGLDTTVAPASERPMSTLINVARVYHHSTHGTLVCVEPSTMTVAERKSFFDVDGNLHSGHIRRIALFQGTNAQEMIIYTKGSSGTTFTLISRARDNNRTEWTLTDANLLHTLPYRATNVTGLDVEIKGLVVRFDRLNADSAEWIELCSNFAAGKLNWKKETSE